MAKDNVQKMLQEREKMFHDLESKRKELDQRTSELSKREALTELEKQKLEEEKRQVTSLFSQIMVVWLIETYLYKLCDCCFVIYYDKLEFRST